MSNARPALYPMLKYPLAMLFGWLLSAQTTADVRVAATIRPLQFIAEAIVGETGAIHSIVDERESPHNYSVTPGDRLVLEQADLLLWVGPEFEVYLADIVSRLADRKALVTSVSLPRMTLHSLADGRTDPHIWLNPNNAVIIAEALAGELSLLSPGSAATYRRNLADFKRRAATTRHDVSARLGKNHASSYIVYHDTYQYFEREFGLRPELTLLFNPDVQPSIRDILSMRGRIRELAPDCVILESDSDFALVDTLLRGLRPARIIVDPLGFGIEADGGAYFRLLKKIAAGFDRCLIAAHTE